jgi:predicted O-methyltransferase YrrM
MTIWNTQLTEDIEDYLIGHSQFNNTKIEYVFNSAYKFDEPYMQISKLQTAYLQFFVSSNNIKKILEVGTFVGYSSFVMALSLKNKDEIQDAVIYSIENNKKHYEQAVKNLLSTKDINGVLKDEFKGTAVGGINYIFGDAKDIIKESEIFDNVDLFFLDGDKINYNFYLDWVLINMKAGSYFLIDNILFKGGVLLNENEYSKSVRQMTEKLKATNAFNFFISPIGDGMLIARKI